MTWTKLGDEMPDRPAIWRLSDGAFRLHVSGLAYCNRILTEAIVPRDRLGALVPHYDPAQLEELVGAGVWTPAGDDFRIIDSADDQLSKADVLALREKRAAAGRQGGLVSGRRRRREATGQASAIASASSKREANGNPGPSRPEGRREERISQGGSARPAPHPGEDDDVASLLTAAADPYTVPDDVLNHARDLVASGFEAGILAKEIAVALRRGPLAALTYVTDLEARVS